MIPIYLLIGLINVLAKHNNYGIQIKDPEFHVKVRRSLQDTPTEVAFNLDNNIENQLKTDVRRVKRYAYYRKTNITNNQSLHNNINDNNGTASEDNGYRYTISNPAWNNLFNNSSRKNNLRSNNALLTSIRSYPYGYPPGYAPKTNDNNVYTGYNNTAAATPGYTNANSAPYFYNYQYPNRQNFGGYYGYNTSRPGYNNFNTPGYTPNPDNNNNFTNMPVYPSGYNTPGPSPDNRGYFAYNNFNNIPLPYTIKPVSAPYITEPNKNGYVAYNGTTTGFNYNTTAENPGNISTTPGYNATQTTTPNIVTACVICNIPCPKFMRRFGRFCVDDKEGDDY